jgi:hypothetical protein
MSLRSAFGSDNTRDGHASLVDHKDTFEGGMADEEVAGGVYCQAVWA